MGYLFDRAEIEEMVRKKQEKRTKENAKDIRNRQIKEMKKLGTCLCGKSSDVPTGWCVDCWNKVEGEIRAEFHQPE